MKVARTVGVSLYYGHEFIAFCPDHSRTGRALLHIVGAESVYYALPEANDTPAFWCSRSLRAIEHRFYHTSARAGMATLQNPFWWIHFDLLVGADGVHSRVRQLARIPYRPQRSFGLGEHNLTLPNIQQTSVILNFATAESLR